MDGRPIGIFDSGVGGLTVVKQIRKRLPKETIIYFGDTARVPYGSKSKETVTRFSREDIRFLLSKEVKAVIIACNTASSNSLETLEKEFPVPLFGTVDAGVSDALQATKNNRIGIIGTVATIRSMAYQRGIVSKNPKAQVFAQACPLFVPLAEEGWTQREATYAIAREYLEPLEAEGIDTLILGCTHYPLLRDCIQEVAGEQVRLIDPAIYTAEMVAKYLERTGMQRDGRETADPQFYVSDMTEQFQVLCDKALEKQYPVEKIEIEQYADLHG